LFSISINFPTCNSETIKIPSLPPGFKHIPIYEVLNTYMILSVRFINHKPVYGARYYDTHELFSDEISQEEMAEKIIEIYLDSLKFDPYSGVEKPRLGFV
jgi:hypothetical protein